MAMMRDLSSLEDLCAQHLALLLECEYSVQTLNHGKPTVRIHHGSCHCPNAATHQKLQALKTRFLELLSQETNVKRLYSLLQQPQLKRTEIYVFILKRLEALLPEQALFYTHLAMTLVALGEDDEAYRYVQRAKQLDPALRDALYLQLDLVRRTLNQQQIQSAIQEILAVSPKDPVALAAREKLIGYTDGALPPLYEVPIGSLASANLEAVLKTTE